MTQAVTTSVEPAIYRLKGYLGIRSAKLRPDVQLDLQDRLSLKSRPWRDFPPTEVKAYYTKDNYFWVPRFYFDGSIQDGRLGKYPIQYDWTEGVAIDLPNNVALDPNRGQPAAVDAMEAYLRQKSGGILVAPTGCGKTILGYSVAQRFKTAIGVLVYNGHMLDNWIKTAHQVFGLQSTDVGVVQSEQCDLGKPVTIMMIQSLLSRDYPKELYDQIGFLIGDEVPRFGAPQWNEVLKQFPARYRLGLSADPKRDDGLDKLIEWHFGKVGHTIGAVTAKPDVVQVLYRQNYEPKRFLAWGKSEPDPMKYDKLLRSDAGRNAFIVGELVKARTAGRRILVFSRLIEHLKSLKEAFDATWDVGVLDQLADDNIPIRPATKTTMLVGGLSDARREDAMGGDVIFTTYAFARDALNRPSIDTLVFATPPGKVLQPIGRLRDKGDPDRRPLLAIDIYELPDYSKGKARRRVDTYNSLGLKVIHTEQSPKVLK